VERSVVDIGLETLRSLAGRCVFEAQPNLFANITVDSGRVMAEVVGQVRTAIYPESETRYFSLDQDLDFVFSRADDGKVSGCVLTAGSATYKAKRVD
jgi:hypothetical protein